MPNYRVIANALRLRSGPATSYEVVGMLYRNTIVSGEEIVSDWVHITGDKIGWSYKGYLELQQEAPPPTEGQASYRVDAASLNLRQGPGTNFAVVGSLKKSELVTGLAVSSDSQWAQVRKENGVTGWASLQYMTKVAMPGPNAGDIQMIVTTDSLNIRLGPGTDYSVEEKASRGERLTYIKATSDWRWVNIKTNAEKIGWVASRYVMEQNELFASPQDYPVTGLHRALSDMLPMREEPDIHSPIVTELKFNRVVIVDAISSDGTWKHCTNAWGEDGWYPVERLAALGSVAIQQSHEEFPWLLVAFAEFGTREIPGSQHNPMIVAYLNSTDLAEKYPSLPDETDWCAAFVNWCIEKVGLPSMNSALVNPWRSWGKASNPPRRGSVTTFLWDDGWAHASFYLGEIGNYVVCLGGNQSDAVWISVYHKKYVTSYRVLE